MSKPTKHICIHGHFYQPPRENPWLEAIEVQDSAAPYHDWNARITAECYGPNSRARILYADGRIARIVNNYARISFNFGPTLLSWMEQHAPEVLEAIVEGDRASVERHAGHGNAIAQVYNHAILPLCSAGEKRLQVRWGLADFRARFGREPEGMWLAETAADTTSLEALAEEGLRFTILAPRQAARWREIGADGWQDGPIDTSRPYRCTLPSGRSIALFFYHGPLAQAVAFEKLLNSGDRLADRLLAAFAGGPEAQLVHVATDGETYGHHHRYGEMALAYALEKLDRLPDVALTNYGLYLEEHPPLHEVEILELTSWSCVHGVERWRSDCGCNSGAGGGKQPWSQKWRAPLRQGLRDLKHELDGLYQRKGKEFFRDPAAALDEYVGLVLDRSAEGLERFLARHLRRKANDEAVQARCLKLLEMQRHGLLMFTSCGWFFDEISGLETTQILFYAARAIQLAQELAPPGKHLGARLLERLAEAPSNLPQHGEGAAYWSKAVAPAVVDLPRVLAHAAMTSLFQEATGHRNGRLYCYEVTALEEQIETLGRSRLAVGSIALRSSLTLESARSSFAALYIDRLDMHCWLGPALDAEAAGRQRQKLFACYRDASVLDLYQMLQQEFQGRSYRLGDLFIEEQRGIVLTLTEDRFEQYVQVLERLAAEDEWLAQDLARLRYPIPPSLFHAVSMRMDRQLGALLERLEDQAALERFERLLERGRAFGYRPEAVSSVEQRIAALLEARLAALETAEDPAAEVGAARRLLAAAALLQVEPHLWQAQNRFLEVCRRSATRFAGDEGLKGLIEGFAPRLGLTKQMLPWNGA